MTAGFSFRDRRGRRIIAILAVYAEMFSLQASSYIDDPRDLVDS